MLTNRIKKFILSFIVILINTGSYASQSLLDLSLKFTPVIEEFDVTVPLNYEHDKQIDLIIQQMKKLDTGFTSDKGFTSNNFARASYKLVPGKTYRVKFFPILKGKDNNLTVTSNECLTFLKSQKAILVGGQGLTLLYSLNPDKFPAMRYIVALDEKEALWKDSKGRYNIPMIGKFFDDKPMFDLGFFDDDGWTNAYYLLAFFEK